MEKIQFSDLTVREIYSMLNEARNNNDTELEAACVTAIKTGDYILIKEEPDFWKSTNNQSGGV